MKKNIRIIIVLTTIMFSLGAAWGQSNLPPVIISQPQSILVTNLTSVAFNVGVTGTGPFTYQWLLNGTNLPMNVITTVVGTGPTNLVAEPQYASKYDLASPSSVVADNSGNLFIADMGRSLIPIDHAGIIATNVMDGAAVAPGALALDANGDLFIASASQNRIELFAYGTLITVGASVGLNGPLGLTVDEEGNVFIADTGDARIRKVNSDNVVTTVAGNGTNGFSGDGGPAVLANLNKPHGVCVDLFGNVFIADTFNNRIRKVDTNGVITTVAGNGTAGYGGDGGAATNAALFQPAAVVVDNYGDLFIADTYNSRIRKVDPFGIITTFAGNGVNGYSGDGTAATNASLYNSSGLTLGPDGNLYIADTVNNRIREVAITGPVLTLTNVNFTNAGNYQVVVSSDFGSVTSAVAVLTVEQPPVVTFQPVSQTVLAGGTAVVTAAAIGNAPLFYHWQFSGTNFLEIGNFQGVANSSLTIGPVMAANAGDYSLVVSNAWGSVTSEVAVLNVALPPAVASQPLTQNLIYGQNAVLTVGVTGTGPFSYQWRLNGTNLPNGVINTIAGTGVEGFSGDGGPATKAGLNDPMGLAADAAGDLYVSDSSNNRVREISTNGVISTVAGRGTATFSGDGGVATNASLHIPIGLALTTSNALFIVDQDNDRVRRVDPDGVINTIAGDGVAGFSDDGEEAADASLNLPSDMAMDASGNLFIADASNYRVRKIDTNGIITTVAGDGVCGYAGDGGAATNAFLMSVRGLAVDTYGNLFIADSASNRIRKVDLNGIITTVVGTGLNGFSGDGRAATNANLQMPTGLAIDSAGNLFIDDVGNFRIRCVNPRGIITTVVGNGKSNFSGDGGVATNASIAAQDGLLPTAGGPLIFADSGLNRIREVTYLGPVLSLTNVTAAGTGNYQVIVSSAWGSVTSSVATLTGTLPQISVAGFTNDAVLLNVLTAPNVSSELWATTNLIPPVVWQPVSTNIPGTSGIWQYTDTNVANYPARFYRTTTP